MPFINSTAVLTLKEIHIDDNFIKYSLESITSFSFLIAEAGVINYFCVFFLKSVLVWVFYAVVYVN